MVVNVFPRITKFCILAAVVTLTTAATGQVLDNKTLTAFVKKNQSVLVTKGAFETIPDMTHRLSYLERDFVVVFAPIISDYDNYYKYDTATQRLTVMLKSTGSVSHRGVFDEPPAERYKSTDQGPGSDTYLQERNNRTYNLYMLATKKDKQRSYIGRTAFGAQTEMTSDSSESWGLAVMNFDKKDLDKISVTLEIAPETAKSLVKQLVWQFVGATTVGVWDVTRKGYSASEWALESNAAHEATLDSPYSYLFKQKGAPSVISAILLVNKATGEVLKEFKAQ